MTGKTDEWTERFQDAVISLTDMLLRDAKKFDTYGEATKFVKQVRQQAYGSGLSSDIATMKVNDAICGLVLHQLHDEERSLPIKRGEDE